MEPFSLKRSVCSAVVDLALVPAMTGADQRPRALALAMLLLALATTGYAACSEEFVQHGVVYGVPESGCCGAPNNGRILCDPTGGSPGLQAQAEERCADLVAASTASFANVSAFGGTWRGCEAQCDAQPDCTRWSLEPAGRQADGAWRPALCRLAAEPLACSPAHCASEGAVSGRKDCEAVLLRRLAAGPVDIRVVSEGYNGYDAGRAEFYLDGQLVSVPRGRGLKVVLLHLDGSLNSSHVFDTHGPDGSGPLAALLNGLPQGTPILIAARDDAKAGLTAGAKLAMRDCGATDIDDLHFRSAYALIGVKGGTKLAEAVLAENQGEVEIAVQYEEGATTTTFAPTTTPPQPPSPCSDYACPSGQIHKLNAWNVTGSSANVCCDAAADNVIGIMVKSAGWGSGNLAEFYLNGAKLSFSARRGMNVVVLRSDGTVVRSAELRPQTFDTSVEGPAANLTAFLDRLENGTVVLMAARDDANARLTAEAKAAVERCGGALIGDLHWRSSYALIGVKGGLVMAEQLLPREHGMAVAIARLAVEPGLVATQKPVCNARMSNPPVQGWVANKQLELESGCRYELWEGENAATCLDGSWMVVVGGSNTVLMAVRLANMLAPEAIMPVRDGATMGGFTVVDVIIRDGAITYNNSQKIEGCSALPYDAPCKAGIASLVAEAPAYTTGVGGTRITLFEARFWDHADTALDTLISDTRWAGAPMAMVVQVSTWYIYCAAMKLAWCPRHDLNQPDLTHPQALALFKDHMSPVVSKLETLCVPGGRAEKHGCVVTTTSWQNPASSRLPFYNDYNAAILGALDGKTSEVLRIVDLWTLGQAFPEENILGHGSPFLNLWNWQVMLGGMCPSEQAAEGTFAEFEGALCFGSLAKRVQIPGSDPAKYDLAPATGSRCPDYWRACPTQGGAHLRCEPWECANSMPCTLTAVVKDLVQADLTGACYDKIAWSLAAGAEGGEEEQRCRRVWCDDSLEFVPAVVATSLVLAMLVGSKLWERLAPQSLREKLGGPSGSGAKKREATGQAVASAASREGEERATANERPPEQETNAKEPDTAQRARKEAGQPAGQQATRDNPALLLDIKDFSGEGQEKPAATKAADAPPTMGSASAPRDSAAVVLTVQDTAEAKSSEAGKSTVAAAKAGPPAAAKPKGAGDKFPLGLARMCASLHVVVGHLYAKPDVIPSVYFFGWGFTWVPWFFMLSGFVLFTAHLRRPKEEGVLEYVMRRSVTIYPLYAVSLIPAFAIAKALDKAPSAIILVAQSWLIQAWVPFWTEKALQMHCWFLSAMVVYWFLFKPLSRCLRGLSLRATVAMMSVLFFLPWLVVLIPALAEQSVTWYTEHSQNHTDTWLDLVVVFLKFHPACYLHVFVLGMLLAKLRLLLDAKAVAAGMPRYWRWPMEFVSPAGYAGLCLVFFAPALRPWGYKLSTRLSVLLPFQAAVLFGLAGLPSLPQGRVAALASRFDFLENYSYAVYVFQFICYSVWPKRQQISLPLFLVFLLMTAVFVVHTVQRPVQRWWGKHPRARWCIPVVLSLALGGLELFLPRPDTNMDIPALIRHDSRMVDMRLPLEDAQSDGGSLMNPSLLVRDGQVFIAARRHRLETTQRNDDGSCAKHGAMGCTIMDQTWHSQIVLGAAPLDEDAWRAWPASDAPPFRAQLKPWSALRTSDGQPWAHLCVRETYEPKNNTLIRHVVTGPEDPKLVPLSGGAAAVVFNSLPPKGADGCRAEEGLAPVSQMYLAEHSSDPARAVGRRLDHGSKIDAEKNWIPFAVNGTDQLHFVYEPVPHAIIACQVDGDMSCESRYADSFRPLQRFKLDNPGLAEWRGSAQAVLISDGTLTPNLPRGHYLALLHAVELETKRYVHYAYRFTAEPPHAILQVSKQLPLEAAPSDSNTVPFAFASGLTVHGGVVAISYGAGDRDARVLVLTLDRLDEFFACGDKGAVGAGPTSGIAGGR